MAPSSSRPRSCPGGGRGRQQCQARPSRPPSTLPLPFRTPPSPFNIFGSKRCVFRSKSHFVSTYRPSIIGQVSQNRFISQNGFGGGGGSSARHARRGCHLLCLCHFVPSHAPERDFFIDNLLVRIHFIIVMIRWTGLAPWVFEFPFPGSLTSTFLTHAPPSHDRCRAKREHLERFCGLLPGSHGQNLALTFLYVPCSLDRGLCDTTLNYNAAERERVRERARERESDIARERERERERERQRQRESSPQNDPRPARQLGRGTAEWSMSLETAPRPRRTCM